MSRIFRMFAVALGAALLSLVLVRTDTARAFGFFSKYETVRAAKGFVSLPASAFADGRAHYYSYDAEGREIRFFVLKSSDGVIRAAFDACDVCYESRKGYVQDGDVMVCQNCGQRFHSARINEVRGGCNPAPLPRVLQGDAVRIKAANLVSGAHYF